MWTMNVHSTLLSSKKRERVPFKAFHEAWGFDLRPPQVSPSWCQNVVRSQNRTVNVLKNIILWFYKFGDCMLRKMLLGLMYIWWWASVDFMYLWIFSIFHSVWTQRLNSAANRSAPSTTVKQTNKKTTENHQNAGDPSRIRISKRNVPKISKLKVLGASVTIVTQSQVIENMVTARGEGGWLTSPCELGMCWSEQMFTWFYNTRKQITWTAWSSNDLEMQNLCTHLLRRRAQKKSDQVVRVRAPSCVKFGKASAYQRLQ